MCVVALGTFIIPMFDKELAISMNHMMISFLPGSFEPLKFVSDDLDISQKGQLVFRNLPLLPLVIFYPVSYLIVLATAKKRPIKKTILGLFSVYIGFYITGLMASTLFTSMGI